MVEFHGTGGSASCTGDDLTSSFAATLADSYQYRGSASPSATTSTGDADSAASAALAATLMVTIAVRMLSRGYMLPHLFVSALIDPVHTHLVYATSYTGFGFGEAHRTILLRPSSSRIWCSASCAPEPISFIFIVAPY